MKVRTTPVLKHGSDDPDVIIIGGGLSGVLIAEKLSAARLNCLVLEAGPLLASTPPAQAKPFVRSIQPSLKLDESAWRFKSSAMPYDWLRVRAAGGRSLLWGGWCVPLDSQSLRDAKAFQAPWPLTIDELEPHYKHLKGRFAIQRGALDPSFRKIKARLGLEVSPKIAALHPSGLRPFVALDVKRHFLVRPQSVVLRLLAGKDGRVDGVEYLDLATISKKVIRARAVVLCASPIESARLLLSSEELKPLIAKDWVGKGLVDHLVASYLVVMPSPAPTPGPLKPLERAAYIPRFVNRGGSSRRDYRSGFILELRGPIALAELGLEDIEKIGISRKDAAGMSYYMIHALGESAPNVDRYLSLHPKVKDSLGRRIPVVYWAWGEDEPRMARDMEETALAVADTLAPPGSRVIPFREALKPGGIAHEAGTCRMGRSPSNSVTNPFGAVHGVGGLYVADASVMPTALDRYPTMTVLALAIRTADHILEKFTHAEL